MGSVLIEASDGRVAMTLSGAQTLMRSELESPVLTSAVNLKGTALKPSLSGVFHSDGDNVLIEPKRFQKSLVIATATTIPSTAHGFKNSKRKLPIQSDMPSTVPNIPPSAADLAQKQELLAVSPVRSGNEQHMKLEESQENSESDQAVLRRRALESISQSTSSVDHDGTVLDQAAALKSKIELTANKSLEDLTAPFILNNEENVLRAFIPAAMADAATNNRSVLRSRGGLSALQAVAAAAAVGAIGAWAALAFF